MHRRFRLRSRQRFQQVREQGQVCRHRLAILLYLPNDLPGSRFGVSASRRVGKAVRRNRARRLLREAVRQQRRAIASGWDLVFIARPAIADASFQEVVAACQHLLRQAGLWQDEAAV